MGTDPKFADIYQMRGCAFFKLGNLAAGDWATFLRRRQPEKEAEHWQIGVAYALLGSHEEARKQLEWHWTVNSGDMRALALPQRGAHGRRGPGAGGLAGN